MPRQALTFRLERDLILQVRDEAAQREISVTGLVEASLRQYLKLPAIGTDGRIMELEARVSELEQHTYSSRILG